MESSQCMNLQIYDDFSYGPSFDFGDAYISIHNESNLNQESCAWFDSQKNLRKKCKLALF